VVGRVYLLSRDQLGCRFLQRQLEEGPPEAVDLVFNEASREEGVEERGEGYIEEGVVLYAARSVFSSESGRRSG
jgi:hypothetical protein